MTKSTVRTVSAALAAVLAFSLIPPVSAAPELSRKVSDYTGAGSVIAAASVSNQAQMAQSANLWTCSCGHKNDGNFCSHCGKAKAPAAEGWTCSCGAVNNGNFCSKCGQPKPQQKFCSNCGAKCDGNFCPNCGQKL